MSPPACLQRILRSGRTPKPPEIVKEVTDNFIQNRATTGGIVIFGEKLTSFPRRGTRTTVTRLAQVQADG